MAPDFGKKGASRINYSDQQDSCYPLLIFILIDFLFIEGTMLYYMLQPTIETNITYFMCIKSLKIALGSSH